ncbi:hypothetical protein NL676_028270 [Syzygium grande]|nr:hypothetical protein NL676_028270 [Syzygium grande]
MMVRSSLRGLFSALAAPALASPPQLFDSQRPRSNPDGIAVTYRCVDPGTLAHVEIKQYDGKNWESSYVASGISSYSKVDTEKAKLGSS